MKLYDFDGMFDEKLSTYIAKNSEKFSESEWEDAIPELYQRFGDTPIKSLGKTPRAFYAEMDGEQLIKCLKAHLKQGVPVSQFLCDAIEGKSLKAQLIPLLDGSEAERDFAINLLGADDSVIKKYLKMLSSADDEELKSRLLELIKEKADLVTDEALELYAKGVERGYMLEIMSRTVIKNEKVFQILIKEFRGDAENIPMHAGYLAAYGDERALEFLLDKIDEEGISFIEYRELKYAIECLGGEYEKERDFSNDPDFELIKSQDTPATDLFGGANNKN